MTENYIDKIEVDGVERPIRDTSGSVRYDAAQSLTDEQKAQARTNINAAPGGFGLGWGAKALTSSDDVNEISASGWYSWYEASVPKNAIKLSWVTIMRVDAHLGGVFVQTAYGVTDANNYYTQPIVARRMRYSSKIGEWEYLNPPMELGTEYRTTERYLGKPVYVQVVDCGTIPAQGTHKDLPLPSDTNSIVSINAYSPMRGDTLPCYDANGVRYSITTSGTTIMIWNYSESLMDTNVRALIKYTKTTD